MRVIIKKLVGEQAWSTMFCVGTIACEEGGQLSNTVLEKMKSHNIIREIDGLEIIEIFHHHKPLMEEHDKCKYYEILNPSIPVNAPVPVVIDPEQTCLECGHKALPKNKFIFSNSRSRKRQVRHSTHCVKCEAEIHFYKKYFPVPADEQWFKDALKSGGETWMEDTPLPN